MTIVFLLAVIIFGLGILILIGMFGKKRRYLLNKSYFDEKWSQLLNGVRTPEGMVLSVIDADKLVDEALRKRHFKGKNMGERLVSAQRELSDNDAVWYAHKLRNRLVHEPGAKLKKREAQAALTGFKHCLRDLGAL